MLLLLLSSLNLLFTFFGKLLTFSVHRNPFPLLDARVAIAGKIAMNVRTFKRIGLKLVLALL